MQKIDYTPNKPNIYIVEKKNKRCTVNSSIRNKKKDKK